MSARYVPIDQISMWRNLKQELEVLRDRLSSVKEGLEAVRAAAAANPLPEPPPGARKGPLTGLDGGARGKGPRRAAAGASRPPNASTPSI